MDLDLELERITNPLRLSAGSHQPGSGKGCAMNVISYTNGDAKITDYPECSARPLARLVQSLNDVLAGPDGYLSPEDSVTVLDLGWLTVGTANVPREVVWQWLAELLTDPQWGVVRIGALVPGPPGVIRAVRRVAGLCRRQASGYRVSAEAWKRALPSGSAVCAPGFSAAASVVAYGLNGLAEPTAAANHAAAAFGDAEVDFTATQVDFTRWAITRWRELAGLDQPAEVTVAAVDYARELIGV